MLFGPAIILDCSIATDMCTHVHPLNKSRKQIHRFITLILLPIAVLHAHMLVKLINHTDHFTTQIPILNVVHIINIIQGLCLTSQYSVYCTEHSRATFLLEQSSTVDSGPLATKMMLLCKYHAIC